MPPKLLTHSKHITSGRFGASGSLGTYALHAIQQFGQERDSA